MCTLTQCKKYFQELVTLVTKVTLLESPKQRGLFIVELHSRANLESLIIFAHFVFSLHLDLKRTSILRIAANSA